jgi:hypothetical protein
MHSYIDFLEMEVLCNTDTRNFRAISHSANCSTELTARLQGTFALQGGYVISAAWLKADASDPEQ